MQKRIGYLLLVVVLGLIALGLIMLFSTSARFATGDATVMYSYLRRQLLWLAVGGVVCVVLSRCDYHWLTGKAWIWVGIAAVLLILCFVPGIGQTIKGASRWIRFAGFAAQPSELAKLAVVLFLAFWLGKHQRQIRELWKGFLVPSLVVGGIGVLILKEPDLGATMHLGIVAVVMLFCAGIPKRYLAPLPFLLIGGILTIAYLMPNRRARLLAFLDPEKHQDGAAYQQMQALIALGSGGTSGLGLGNSRQKMFYLPEAHTDFIFPIMGEELGLWVSLIMVFAFILLVIAGGWISLHAPDPTGVLLGIGITTLVGVQALINLAVVTQLMPNKGLPLPFISYGGSNLAMCLAGIGILFNLQRQGTFAEKTEEGLLPKRTTLTM